MESYSIILAAESDMMQVHDMAEVVFRQTYKDILSPEQMDYMMDWMYSPANLKKQIEDGHVYFLAYRDDTPCAYVSVQPDGTGEDGRMLFHLHKIYVMPSEQGRGLGKKMFAHALSYVAAVADGHPASVELNVNRNNPAVGFYRHLGLKILRQGDFHIGNGFYMNDYIMGIDLNDIC